MAEAEVGDDVFGDDPTVNALEERAAELLGKEAGLFVACGTMGNLVAQMAHVPRGEEIIAGAQSHIVLRRGGRATPSSSARRVRPIRERPDGTLDPDDGPRRVPRPDRRPRADHRPRRAREHATPTRWTSRSSVDVHATRSRAVAHDGGVPLHVDGARLFNAVVALDAGAARRWPDRPTASRSACRRASPARSAASSSARATSSGGRAAPASWSAAGCARSGVLAAAGPGRAPRRAGGHDRSARRGPRERAPPGRGARRARRHRLARRHRAAEPGRLDPGRVATNFVLFRVERDRAAFLDAARPARGVLVVAYPHGQVRAVTHYGVERADVEATIGAVREALAERPARRRRPRPPGRRGRLIAARAPRCRSRRTRGGSSFDGSSYRAAAGADPGPARRPLLRPRRGALPADRRGGADLRDVPRHPRLGRPAGRPRRASGCSATSPPTARTSRRSRRSIPRRCPRRRGSSATWSSTTSGCALFRAEAIRTWERRATGASALGDALFLLFARDFAPLPERLDVDRRPPGGGAALPRRLPDAARSCPRSAVARDRAASERERARASSTRSWRPPMRAGRRRSRLGSAPARARRRAREGRARRLGRVDPGDPARARRRTGRSGASATTSSLAPARLRRPRRRRDPGDRLAAARAQPRGPRGRRARDRSERDRGGGPRARQGRPPGDVRRGARRATATRWRRRGAPRSSTTSRPSRTTSASRSSRRRRTCAA